jgi:ribulose-5-phosphate 4-epimerase/fuculose-1-phosphate aldolase
MTTSSLERIKHRIALACRIMYNEGLREELGFEFAGHISVKISKDKFVMPGHLHDSARGFSRLTPRDMITVDLNNNVIEGTLKPVDEVVIHSEVYKARDDARSVVHMHAPAATAIASTNEPIVPISLRSSYFSDGVPVLKLGPRLIDSQKIARELVRKLGNHSTAIHKGHGIVTVGRTLEEACFLAILLEGSARNQLYASQFGKLVPFDKTKSTEFSKQMNLAEHSEFWKYYERKWTEEKRNSQKN